MTRNIIERFHHLSASHISAFIADPPRWAMERVFKMSTPVGPEAHRGTCVEHGAVAAVTTGKLGQAIETAMGEFADLTKDWDVDEAESVGAPIPAMVEAMAKAIEGLIATHGQIVAVQKRHEFDLFGVPWLGFTDIEFDRLVVDLKTTGRTPSKLSNSHIIQGALYNKRTGKPTSFLYAIPLKGGVNVKSIDLTTEEAEAAMRDVEDAVRRMELVLSLGDDVIRDIYRPAPDSWWLAGDKAANKLARAAADIVWN